MLQSLERSLVHLKTDYIDIYHVHAVSPHQLGFVAAEIVPSLIKAREQGKIRYLGITEAFGAGDTDHRMLRRAIESDVWDVMMIGFNLINPSAATSILPEIREKNLGTIAMFAVPRSVPVPQALQNAIEGGAEVDQITARKTSLVEHPMSPRDKLANVAYRYCRHESAMDVVLTGTGSVEHLRQNVAAINGEPLSVQMLDRLESLLGQADH